MNWKKFLVSGFLAGLTILVVSNVFGFLVQLVWPYNALELGGMRAVDDPILLLFFLHYWVYGFAMALVYPYFSKSFEGNYLQKGKKFGLLMWLVISVPVTFVIYTSMNYPIGFNVSELVGGFLYMLAAGIVIARFGE